MWEDVIFVEKVTTTFFEKNHIFGDESIVSTILKSLSTWKWENVDMTTGENRIGQPANPTERHKSMLSYCTAISKLV
jgi:hypothetical protein